MVMADNVLPFCFSFIKKSKNIKVHYLYLGKQETFKRQILTYN